MYFYVQITALCTGRFADDERDVLLVGTTTHVLAYRVEDNADIFYKEVIIAELIKIVLKISIFFEKF